MGIWAKKERDWKNKRERQSDLKTTNIINAWNNLQQVDFNPKTQENKWETGQLTFTELEK